MTTTTIRQAESIPASWPARPTGLSLAADMLDPSLVWGRIEAFVSHRWASRAVVWTVEGCGEWVPPLTPAIITTVEAWNGDTWETVTLSPSPLGGYVLQGGTYRFTGTAGGGDVPAAVSEAFRRLAEYMAQKAGKAGATSESVSAGSVSIRHNRSASWMAQAMQNSGAADLLRPYRRAG